jgi:hypothetical protein
MMSLKLWRALNDPPRHHPLFQYVLTHAKREEPKVTSGFFMWAFMCSSITFFGTMVLDWIPYLLLGLLILLNTVYALRWVLRISATIVAEKEQRRFDLLASLPIGLLGTSWAISTGCVHRRSSFRWIPYLILLLVGSVVSMLLLFTAMTMVIVEKAAANDLIVIGDVNLLQLGIVGIALMVIFYFDHIYSILTAILIGQIVTIDLKNRVEAQVGAFLGFISLQALLYTITYAVMILVLPSIVSFFGFSGIRVLVSISVMGILFYVFIREILVNFLWNRLIRALHADEKEIALIIQPSYMLEKILKESELRIVQPMDAS